ncbi:zinc finger protein Lobe isoform X4 [Megachile rotundata]|uniref:zinc finger protein Lobe isoform X4 n=1 Tax=Megachile rotundata TaxID=143995 RepID=UPI003FD3A7E4
MSRRKQAKPRSLKRDEEWDEGNEPNVLELTEQDNETTGIKQDEEEEEEEEELQRAFGRHSEEVLGTGSSSWQSEDAGANSRRGGETPSSCATPTSVSFPSEPEVDADVAANADGNNANAPYPCQFCDRTFPRLSYLKKHEQSHGDQMPYRCSWCARLFKHKRSRDRHVKLHTGDRRYRCTHCEAAFSRSDHLKIHMKTHDTQKPYQCTACSRGYNTAAALTSHMQSHKKHHQSQGTKKLQPQEADHGRRSVSSHSTSSPPVASSPSPSLNLAPNPKSGLKSSQGSCSTTPILTSPLKLACMYCTRDSFSCMQQLQMHVHTMHRAILNGESVATVSPSGNGSGEQLVGYHRADKSSSERLEGSGTSADHERKRGTTEKEQYENGPFACNRCTIKFSALASLRDHLLSIHGIDQYGSAALMMCPLCGIPCTSAAAYAEHYVLRHCENRRPLEARDYPETELNGGYDSNTGRSQKRREQTPTEPADLTNKHATETSYTAGTLLCGQCGAALKDFESFREHLARHLQADHRNDLRQHPCPKCDATFQDKEDMLVHLTNHYLGQVSKEYACGACNNLYPHPDLLQRHLLDSHAHHLYRCALCRDTFDTRVAIQVHFAVKHSQECRVYRCNACSTVPDLDNSPGNTTGEGKSFFRSESEMANHVRTVHAPATLSAGSPLATSPASTPGITAAAASSGPRCVFCGIFCGSELELQLHLASHSASLYRCPVCREGFAVEFLLDRHIAQAHRSGDHRATTRTASRENGRIGRSSRLQEESKSQKRGRSPASSNNNLPNQRDNNNKRANYVGPASQQCDLCERGEFANDAELQAHKKVAHSPAGKLQNKSLSNLSMSCAYCGEACRSRTELESHTRIQHASNEPGGRHKCNICDEVCPSGASLAEHKLQKHCKIRLSDSCVVCRGCLTSESQFLEHVQRHSLENVDPQQRHDASLPHLPAACVVCRQTLITDLECRLHARHHLRGSAGSRSLGSSPNPSQKPIQNPIQNPSCCLCLRDYHVDELVSLPPSHVTGGGQSLRVCKSCYVRHSQGLPILNSPYEPTRLKWSSSSKEPPRGGEGSRDKWETDRRNNTEDKTDRTNDGIRCDECGLKFEDSEQAEKHKMLEHDKIGAASNTYTCIQCQMSFSTEAKIQQHVRKDHLESSGKTSVDALRCHLCLFEASSPLQLQSHLIEHTFAGCAALSCYICQSLFTAPIGLQNHMLQEHGLGARPYDCSKCLLKFFFRAELDHHALTFHRPGDATETLQNANETKRDAAATDAVAVDQQNCKEEMITVKEELLAEAAEEDEEEINVEEQAEQDASGTFKRSDADQKFKTEIESVDSVQEKIHS